MQLNAFCNRLFIAWQSNSWFLTTSTEGRSGYTADYLCVVTKTLRVMQWTALFLLGFCLQVSAGVRSQTITFSGKDVPLETVLNAVEDQTTFSVFWNSKLLKMSKPVTIQANNMALKDFLNEVFKGQLLSFDLQKLTIMVKKRDAESAVDLSHRLDSPPPITVRGRIMNEKGEPVIASVTIKGTTRGVVSDANGNVELTSVDDKAILIISATNIETKEIALNGKSQLIISVRSKSSPLDEVIFKGYYSTTKRYNTGSVSKVDQKTIEQQPVSNPLQALIGRMAGVQISQQSGLPGAGFTVRVRGTNSLNFTNQLANDPLYIVDGVPFGSSNLTSAQFANPMVTGLSPFNSLSPNDIASIEVLKDADATAIYGSRGANGVILITTKKAQGEGTKLDINFSHGFSQIQKMLPLLSRRQYLDMRYEAFKNDGETMTLDNAMDLLVWDTTRYTDWQKDIIGGTAQFTNLQAAVSGGSINTHYFFSTSYFKETTVFPGDFGNTKKSAYFNFDHRSVNQKFSLAFAANYLLSDNKLPFADFTKIALTLSPVAPAAYDAEGSLTTNWNNPFRSLKRKYATQSDNLISNVNLGYRIFPALQAKLRLGYNMMSNDQLQTEPIASQPSSNSVFGNSNFGFNTIHTWLTEPELEYKHYFNKSVLTILGGMTFQETVTEGMSILANGYTSDALIENVNAAAVKTVLPSTYAKYHYNAIYGQLNYRWKDKYLLNITGRRDGSSKFGPGKKFGLFGAVGAGWIFSEEHFIQDVLPFISYGKLGGSYGSSGNDNIGDYGFLSTYSPTYYPYLTGGGLIPTQLFNPDYSWETNKKAEASIELGFLQDKILFNTTYFRNRASKQLIGYPLSGVTGFASVQYNLPATVENTGWEFEVSTSPVNTKNFKWTTDINLTIPKNKLIAYPNLAASSNATRLIIGEPITVRPVFHYTGVDPTTGVYTFEDFNKDGGITSPEDLSGRSRRLQYYFGGMNNSFSYKGLQLVFLIQFVRQIGNNYLSPSSWTTPGFFSAAYGDGNQPAFVMKRWQKPGDATSIQKFTQTYSDAGIAYLLYYPNGSSDAATENTSFIRFKSVSLNWNIPQQIIQAAKLKSTQVFIQAQNLFTISDYFGDPETMLPASLSTLRTVAAGIRLTF